MGPEPTTAVIGEAAGGVLVPSCGSQPPSCRMPPEPFAVMCSRYDEYAVVFVVVKVRVRPLVAQAWSARESIVVHVVPSVEPCRSNAFGSRSGASPPEVSVYCFRTTGFDIA